MKIFGEKKFSHQMNPPKVHEVVEAKLVEQKVTPSKNANSSEHSPL